MDIRLGKIGKTVAVTALTMLLGGCVAVALGGAAAGGYYVGQDERTAGEIAEDIAITGAVKSRLLKDKGVQGLQIDVDTRGKEVTLSGQVTSSAQASRAIELAREVRGVGKVISRLQVRKLPPVESSM